MIFSKANLTAANVASQDPADAAMNTLRLNADGSSVAMNGSVVMAVGPIDAGKVSYPNFAKQAAPGPSGVGIPLELLGKVKKNLPKEKRPQIQCAALTRTEEPGEIGLTTTDLMHVQTVTGHPSQDVFPPWKGIFKKIKGGGGVRICLRRADLIQALAALDAACPDKGSNDPVFLELHPESKGVVLRCINRETNQRAVAGLGGMLTKEGMIPTLPLDEWERSIFDTPKVIIKKK